MNTQELSCTHLEIDKTRLSTVEHKCLLCCSEKKGKPLQHTTLFPFFFLVFTREEVFAFRSIVK